MDMNGSISIQIPSHEVLMLFGRAWKNLGKALMKKKCKAEWNGDRISELSYILAPLGGNFRNVISVCIGGVSRSKLDKVEVIFNTENLILDIFWESKFKAGDNRVR